MVCRLLECFSNVCGRVSVLRTAYGHRARRSRRRVLQDVRCASYGFQAARYKCRHWTRWSSSQEARLARRATHHRRSGPRRYHQDADLCGCRWALQSSGCVVAWCGSDSETCCSLESFQVVNVGYVRIHGRTKTSKPFMSCHLSFPSFNQSWASLRHPIRP